MGEDHELNSDVRAETVDGGQEIGRYRIWIFGIVGSNLIGFVVLLLFASRITDYEDWASIVVVGILSVLSLDVVTLGTLNAYEMKAVMERQEVEMTKQRQATQDTVQLTQRVVEEMKRQRESTDRPWLAVDVKLTGRFTYEGDFCRLPVRLTVKNVGRSVAVNTKVNAVGYVPTRAINIPYVAPDHIWEEVRDVEKRVCDPTNSELGSRVIFPERDSTMDVDVSIRRASLQKAILSPEFNWFFLIVCVSYRVSGYDRYHKTSQVYEVLIKTRTLGNDCMIEDREFRKGTRPGSDHAD